MSAPPAEGLSEGLGSGLRASQVQSGGPREHSRLPGGSSPPAPAPSGPEAPEKCWEDSKKLVLIGGWEKGMRLGEGREVCALLSCK